MKTVRIEPSLHVHFKYLLITKTELKKKIYITLQQYDTPAM